MYVNANTASNWHALRCPRRITSFTPVFPFLSFCAVVGVPDAKFEVRHAEANPMKKFCVSILCLVLPVLVASQDLPNSPSAQKAKLTAISADTGWPRTLKDGVQEFVIYQPQVDKWDGNRIYLYSAVERKKGAQAPSQYGVVWFSARTEVDKINRLVTLDDLDISKIHFPTAAAKDAAILAILKAKMPGRTKTISLDRLEAGVRAAAPKLKGMAVKNDSPKIIFSTKPSLLITIDGEPRLVAVQTTDLQRVVNTSSIVLFESDKKKFYVRVMDWWMEAPQLDGPWTYASKLPDEMKKAEEYIAEKTKTQVPQNDPALNQATSGDGQKKQASLKEAGKKAEIPIVFVVYAPTELVEIKGEPQYAAIPGTDLEYVANTNGTILRFGGEHYILISGRWFKNTSLNGEWTFVDGSAIPAEFAKIPADSPKASALASVPGTAQAEEGLIANSIPQTATITRSEAKLTVVYDGEAIFVPIEGTTMKYARNTSVPVVKVEDRYYSVEAGVWFTAPTPQGPWRVSDQVPEEIYTIAASSPLHYVTYAKVYGSTPDVVYVGYTPGYYGTVVSSNTMTVVYGTGWYYPPYIGPTVWYGYPYTYGVGAGFTWTDSSGWSLGFGYGYSYYPWYYPWWGPMGYYGCCWYPYYGWGAWGGAAVANVYGRWGNTAYSRTAAAWANPYTGNYGAASRGATYNTQTGRVAAGGRGYNTNIYTGNTAGYRGGAVYDPNSGIVAGGGAGFVGNRYTGEGVGGRGGFVYDTNKNAGIAAGKNNIYAGKDGTVYRYDRNSGNWSQNSGNGWQAAERPGGSPTPTPSLQRQQEARAQGTQRSQNFNSMRSSPSYRSAPMRMGGGRRR